MAGLGDSSLLLVVEIEHWCQQIQVGVEERNQHRQQWRNERMLRRTQEKLVEYLTKDLTKDLTKAVLDVYCEVKMKGKTDKNIFFHNADTWCAKMSSLTGFRINTTTLVRPHPQPGED